MKIQEVPTSSKTMKYSAKKHSKMITDKLSAEVLNKYTTGATVSAKFDPMKLINQVETLKKEKKYLIEKITEER